MAKFQMSWYDFENYQFVYDDETYSLARPGRYGGGKKPLRHSIMFLLNIHRGNFVNIEDLIEFVWDDQDPDEWPDTQENIIRVMIYNIKKIFLEALIL